MTETLTAPRTFDGPGPHASDNVKHLCRLDLKGAGQISIQGEYAYVGYMSGPEGTSILDISDPRRPKMLSTIMLEGPKSLHSHKVRPNGDIMIVNAEARPAKPGFQGGGFKIYDITDKTKPKLIHFEKTFGKGVHRFDCDENFAYISTEVEGFVGNILVVYDIRNPSKPEEVGRWWMPGQNVAAGEEPHPKGAEHRLHHALRYKDQFYAGCWMSGLAIIDASDLSNMKTLSHLEYHPPALEPGHTFLRVPFQLAGRDIAIATDEERGNRKGDKGKPHAPFYVYDVGDPTKPELLSTYHVGEDESPYNGDKVRFGAHQFQEKLESSVVFITWFAAGLRMIDIADPCNPKQVGYFIPEPAKGRRAPNTNDVALDHRGLVYITDKTDCFDVIEFNG
ncbi:MAG: RNA polymerase subunit sigma-70 [Alphaproteobacteria bacterium]